VRKWVEKEEAIQIDRSCRALSARIKEFGGKQRAISRVFQQGLHSHLCSQDKSPSGTSQAQLHSPKLNRVTSD